MSPAEAEAAVGVGVGVAEEAMADGAEILLIGEMGIGNTSAAALLMHRLLPAPLDACIGPGAGHDEAGLARKRAVLAQAAARTDVVAPAEVLAEFGGLEIAAMAGAVLAAAARRRPIVVDGFIASAAALVAIRLAPDAAEACFFAHRSAETGHARLLAELGAAPLLDLGLRLGEGTGALAALPLVRAASRILPEIASLADVLAGRI